MRLPRMFGGAARSQTTPSQPPASTGAEFLTPEYATLNAALQWLSDQQASVRWGRLPGGSVAALEVRIETPTGVRRVVLVDDDPDPGLPFVEAVHRLRTALRPDPPPGSGARSTTAG